MRMIDSVIFFLLGFSLVIIQTTLFSFFPLSLFTIDFSLIITIYLGFYRRPFQGSLLSFLLGYVLDVFSGGPSGLYAFLRVLSFGLSKALSGKIFINGFLPPMAVVFVFSIVDYLSMIILMKVFQLKLPGVSVMILTPLKQAVLTALFSPLVFRLLHKIEGWQGKVVSKKG